MTSASDPLPDDIDALKALVRAERAARVTIEAEAKVQALEIERLKLMIAKLRRERFGASSERGARLLEQLELQLADLEERAAEVAVAAEIAHPALAAVEVRGVERRKPARRPLPEHLPRERVVHPAPSACPDCGGALRKLGEDITETLERVPARWMVIQHVRAKLSCRVCEAISQPPAPSHPIARGRAGPGLLAQVLVSKYGDHLPLHRQSAIYGREGIELEVSTLADWVGASAATLMPLIEAIRAHVFGAARLHADDTPVPVLATGKTRTGRLWVYVRDDRPFAGPDPPAAAYFYSRDRGGVHPERHLACYAGLMQADAYAGFERLYQAGRRPGPIIEAACWAHARRKLFELAELKRSPIALEAVRRIDALFALERAINGATVEDRIARRQAEARPLVAELHAYLSEQRARLSAKNELAKAIDYGLKRWTALTRYLDDGRLCLSNNAAERALRGVAIGRKNWTFAGSDAGGERAAALYTLIETAKLNDVDPRAWLADVLARLQDHPARRIAELLPWTWQPRDSAATLAA